MTVSKSELEEPDHINKYISLLGKLMWYITKVGTGVANVTRELSVHMIHPGTGNCK